MIGNDIGIAALGLLAAMVAAPIKAAEPVSCDAALSNANTYNGFALFEGASACADDQREADANFLIIAGQVRAITDLTILKPVDTGMERAAALYGQIYYQFGGLGFETVYRTAASTSALESRLRGFAPALAAGYDPGWNYLASSKTDIYDAVLLSQRDERVWEMLNYALRLQDDRYFAIQQELNQLMRDNNAMFTAGSAAAGRYSELAAQQRELTKSIPQLPAPAIDTSYLARLNEPDADMAAVQVAAGFNGPANVQGIEIWRSEAEVRSSWLPAALAASELDAILARTDFSAQSLVGYTVGAFTRASGDIQFSQLRYNRHPPGYSVSISLGVVPEECGVASATSYPFVVGLVEAVPGGRVSASGRSNFPSECQAVVSGEPAALP